jgi:hypothetical protein
LLAAALRGEAGRSPEATASDALERIDYHGIAGLLAERADKLRDWPSAIVDAIRERALSQSMWELRHRLIVGQLLERMAAAGVVALLLKGTALAYDVYDRPASRRRGDTDLLVAPDGRASARKILHDCGFNRELEEQDMPEALRSQEGWTCNSQDGTSHSIDLHWQPLNTPALGRTLKFEEMTSESRHLPKLCEAALAPSRPLLLFHACLHRGLHNCSPYFVGGRTYFGGNRLIWLDDLVLLGKALSDAEWSHFSRIAVDKRMGDVCLEGLEAAESRFGRFVPPIVRHELSAAPPGSYFRSGQFGRAILDACAVPGVGRKWRYAWARSLPSAGFIRAKYDDMADRPLAALYVRRFAELLRERPRNGRADRA